MAVRTAVHRTFALPVGHPFAVRAKGPVAVNLVVAAATDLVGLVKADFFARRGVQFVAIVCIVAVKTPEASVPMIQHTRVRRE
jgi:hypothetical protein